MLRDGRWVPHIPSHTHRRGRAKQVIFHERRGIVLHEADERRGGRQVIRDQLGSHRVGDGAAKIDPGKTKPGSHRQHEGQHFLPGERRGIIYPKFSQESQNPLRKCLIQCRAVSSVL